MRVSTFLFLCLGFYALWLLHDGTKHGILHKERRAVEQTLIKAQGLIDHLCLTAECADKTIKEIKADYQVKTKAFPRLLQALHHLLITLKYGFIVIFGLFAIGIVKYLVKN